MAAAKENLVATTVFFAGAPVFSEKSFVSPLILIFAKVQYKSHKNVFCQIN